ncbi:tetratricopeptide repeat-containing sensor histidine kinase [Flavobacterium cerinum]|uniref:histidine kinase n=1 Tax=Flavobacterium cerinum TaxID=2502784 RepID=A0ABY5IT52_9FLAO|nr:ATP-binding protein [Flavobacterium cerinum]UUC44928.1 tetratricopeptide repeat-containing sensor histidine kinase [Flavobacterium cerinum]
MISQNKLAVTFIALLLSNLLFSQQQSHLDAVLKQKAQQYKEQPYFYKAQQFFIAKNWDSTLVYSMKQLALRNNNEIADYCHYFRGFSFKNKGLNEEGRKEFETITKNFRFNYKVSLYLGEIALEEGNYQKAIAYFKEIDKLPQTGHYDFKKGVVYHNIGLSYLHLNNFKDADHYLSEGFSLLQAEKDTVSLIGAYMSIANLYYEQYKDDMAIPYFKKAYDFSKKTNNPQLKMNTALNMAVVAENNKDFTNALIYRKEYENWRDSLNDQNKIWAIADLEKKFMVTQKEKEIDILEAENKLKIAERNGFFYSSVLLLILFGTGIYFYRQKSKTNKIILSQKNELDELNAAKDQLFSIVSHDLRSSVNALKNSNNKLLTSLEKKEYNELDKLLHHNNSIANSSYNLLDNLLHWALMQTKQFYFHKESVHLHSIVQQVAYNYTPLMTDKNIHFENQVPKSIFVFADQSSLKIVLRNLLDNAIKFTREKDHITITATISDDYCTLIVADSGIGIKKEFLEYLNSETDTVSKKGNHEKTGTGLGMQLCRSMIKKNDGQFHIESEENKGTVVRIQLQKVKKNE